MNSSRSSADWTNFNADFDDLDIDEYPTKGGKKSKKRGRKSSK